MTEKIQTIKAKKLINETSSNFEIFYSLKDTVKKIKSQSTNKILGKHMSDSGLIPRIYKKFI